MTHDSNARAKHYVPTPMIDTTMTENDVKDATHFKLISLYDILETRMQVT